jgi:hypothetical protein
MISPIVLEWRMKTNDKLKMKGEGNQEARGVSVLAAIGFLDHTHGFASPVPRPWLTSIRSLSEVLTTQIGTFRSNSSAAAGSAPFVQPMPAIHHVERNPL